MKWSAFIRAAALCFMMFAIAACAPGNSKDGIKFFEGSLQEALNKAKAEQKPLFIDIYATWCGPCKMLRKNTFTDKEVGAYFNANFIDLSLDGEQADGGMLAARYRIQGYPTLIILNKDGELVNMETGYLEPTDLLAFAKQLSNR